jgi:hypothetical protein
MIVANWSFVVDLNGKIKGRKIKISNRKLLCLRCIFTHNFIIKTVESIMSAHLDGRYCNVRKTSLLFGCLPYDYENHEQKYGLTIVTLKCDL